MDNGEIPDIDAALGAEPVHPAIDLIAEDVISDTNNKSIQKDRQIDSELKFKRK